MRSWFLIALFAACACSQAAELTFERSELAVSPKLGDATATATYRFTVATAGPVHVSAKTSCACLTATFDRDTYQPGERGVLIADLAIGPMVGEQTKTIAVTTDAAGAVPITVTLLAHIPGPKVDPDEVSWTVGESSGTIKYVTITLPDGGPFELVDARSRTGAFLLAISATKQANVFRLGVQPFDAHSAKDDIVDVVTKPASLTTFRARVVPAAPTSR